MEFQKEKIKVAQSRLEQARAESNPSIFGMVIGGYFDNEHLRQKMNYAAGVGIRLPLFEGFRIDSAIHQQESEVKAEEAGLDYSKLTLNNINSQYDEQIQSLQLRLEFLVREKKLAEEVFALARNRYMGLQGTMIDLRESIRNMNRVLQSTDEAYRDQTIARGERALMNGAHE